MTSQADIRMQISEYKCSESKVINWTSKMVHNGDIQQGSEIHIYNYKKLSTRYIKLNIQFLTLDIPQTGIEIQHWK